MRVLVTGGRNYANKERALGKEGEEARTILAAVERERERIWQVLWTLGPMVVIEGAAKGTDQAAYEWAREAGVMPCRFRAEWTRYGNYAGVRRNGVMLREGQPDLVLAFPGGRGTRDMVERARKAGVPVLLSADWVFLGEGS